MSKKTWNGCSELEPDSELYQKYAKKVGEVRHAAWHDVATGVVFGKDMTWGNTGDWEASFCERPETFLANDNVNLQYLAKKHYNGDLRKHFNMFPEKTLVQNSEIVYHDLPQFSKFKDSKILIVGGGPTTKYVDWNAKDYDYVFSCNFFYQSPKLQDLDVAYATMCDEIPLFSKTFQEYVKRSNTIFAFEDCNPSKRSYMTLKKFRDMYPDRVTFVHTRYKSKEGAMSRTLVRAVMLQPREIHLVGMDGLAPTEKQGDVCDHAFQRGKIYQGTCDYHHDKRLFVVLWDYVLNEIGKGIKFQNLGEGHANNMSTDISRQEFPLERR